MPSVRHSRFSLAVCAMVAMAALGCSGGVESVPTGIAPDGWSVTVDATGLDATVPPTDATTAFDTSSPDGTPTPDVIFSGCHTNADCRGNEFGFFVCEPTTGQCVECSPSADTCPADSHCDPRTFRCIRGCRTDEGCATASDDGGLSLDPNLHCNTVTHTCVRCVTDDQCSPGERCVGSACVMGCGTGSRCADGQTCCDNGCVDTANNSAHCGACGHACQVTNGVGSCAQGTCAVASCTGTFRDCDSNLANGCETDTTGDLTNCGGCGRICPSPANGTATCTSGTCGFTCNAGFADCDADPANGCETELASSAMNCGACGRACVVTGAAAGCAMGQCTVRMCEDGLADCDSNPANGCETDLRSSASHCGTCGTVCPMFANATGVCAMGRCRPQCADGFGDCDGDPSNGCEIDLRASALHCGACGTVCEIANGTGVCSMGRCAVGVCTAGWADCDGDPSNGCETDTRSDGAHCGACGRACVTAGGTGACVSGMCTVGLCQAGHGDCDHDPANGCETGLGSDTSNCGVCGRVCVTPHASAVCTAGRCAVGVCETGWADCDGDPSNGCETNTQSSTVHCGGCGHRCSTVNGAPSCTAGVCGVGRCNAGFADCDRDPTNGCETIVESDPSHCGRCNNACAAPPGGAAVCVGGLCAVGSCPAGRADCDGNPVNGCETEISTTNNCGMCGRVCPVPAHGVGVCIAGTCSLGACEAGWADCDGNPANGCEVDVRNTVTACGACGRVCTLPNATAVCTAGRCGVGACSAGWADCDGNPINGCETNTTVDTGNCGRCAVRCAAPAGGTAVCAGGVCSGVCPGGQTSCSGVCQATGGGCTSMGSGGCAQSGTVVCAGTSTVCSARPRESGSCSSPAGGTCASGGVCACPPGQANCGGTCRDLGRDLYHCGACGRACVAPVGGGTYCSSGTCVQTCPAGQSNCGGFCRPTGAGCSSDGTGGCAQSGTVVCAGTGTACSARPRTSGVCGSPTGGVCNGSGSCVCPAGRAICGGRCVDLGDDEYNCGACGRACGAGRACAAGVCVGTGSLRFTLTWDRPGDMDLRVMPPCGTEIYYANRFACGGTLDRDDIPGTGPENIFWGSAPSRGTYRVCPTPYNIRGTTHWTLQIFHGPTRVAVYTGTATYNQGNRRCSSGGYLHTY